MVVEGRYRAVYALCIAHTWGRKDYISAFLSHTRRMTFDVLGDWRCVRDLVACLVYNRLAHRTESCILLQDLVKA